MALIAGGWRNLQVPAGTRERNRNAAGFCVLAEEIAHPANSKCNAMPRYFFHIREGSELNRDTGRYGPATASLSRLLSAESHLRNGRS